jgi:hypothetical protein
MYIFYYCLLHWHICPILQSGGLHYVLIYVSYNEILFLLYLFKLVQQHLCLSCERLCMTGLDDYILQPEHLVGSKLGGMHD